MHSQYTVIAILFPMAPSLGKFGYRHSGLCRNPCIVATTCYPVNQDLMTYPHDNTPPPRWEVSAHPLW